MNKHDNHEANRLALLLLFCAEGTLFSALLAAHIILRSGSFPVVMPEIAWPALLCITAAAMLSHLRSRSRFALLPALAFLALAGQTIMHLIRNHGASGSASLILLTLMVMIHVLVVSAYASSARIRRPAPAAWWFAVILWLITVFTGIWMR